MIKLLLTTGTIFTACALNAQIQTLNPQPGDVFTYEYFELAVPDSGSIGANQTWDYSDATSMGGTLTKTFRALTTQEQGDYPDANIGYEESGDPTLYLMHASADSLVNIGETSFMFSNPIMMYKYPLSSTSDFTDNFGVSGVPMFTFDGTMRTYAQGTGTLITPFGTYNNVIKLRRKGLINMSLGGMSDQIIVDSYVWVNADNKSELLSIESSDYVNDTEEDEIAAYFLKNGAFAGVDELSKNRFKIYPNPAQEVIRLESATAEAPVSYTIFSITGAKAQSGKYTSNGISTGNLQTGEYILQAEMLNGAVSYQKFSKI